MNPSPSESPHPVEQNASVADAPRGTELNDRRIVFFDGVCGLCNRFVNFALDRDPQGRLQFAPLQGPTSQTLLGGTGASLDSVVYAYQGQYWKKSAAVVRILWTLGGLWKVAAALLWIIPLPLRDLGYSIVAKWRYRWFGKSESCRMPQPGEQDRFLP